MAFLPIAHFCPHFSRPLSVYFAVVFYGGLARIWRSAEHGLTGTSLDALKGRKGANKDWQGETPRRPFKAAVSNNKRAVNLPTNL
jgi:hypothetical protein